MWSHVPYCGPMKAMNERRLLKVYLESSDLDRLTGYANRESKTVSEYVREMLLADFVAWNEFDESERKKVDRVQDVPKRAEVRAPERRESAAPRQVLGTCRCGHRRAAHFGGGACNQCSCQEYSEG